MNTYQDCKVLIENNRYNKAEMIAKLDVFLRNNRMTKAEYDELLAMINLPK